MSDSNPAEEKKEAVENEIIENTLSQAEEASDAQKPAETVNAEQNASESAPVPTAPRCENPIIGRKVFFVNPPLYVENYLHLELKQHEYEVYIISDYRYTKVALRHFPDALCFIFIDDEMSYDEWFNFIQSFQDEEVLKTIFVGLMSAIIPKARHERFLMNLSLPGGFIMLNEFKGSALIEKIVGILDLNGAKGRRRYLRLDCDESISINGYFANGSQLLQVSIVNISSVGFVCYFPVSYGEALKKNALVPSFSITLGRRSIVTPSVVFEIKRVDATKFLAVMLFLRQVGADDRKVIKNFIFDQLQDRFEKLVFSAPPDIDDYSNKNLKAAKAEDAADSENTEKAAGSEDAENIEEAEEVLEEEASETAETIETAKQDAKSEQKPADDKAE